jgi:hypothetical protein
LRSKLGWCGTNIDYDRVKIARFKKLGPRDCNICAAVADVAHGMVYLEYSEGTTNRIADSREKNLLSKIFAPTEE